MNDKIIKKHHFRHPINTVWNAISVGEQISNWFIKADFKVEVGYNYTFIYPFQSDLGNSGFHSKA